MYRRFEESREQPTNSGNAGSDGQDSKEEKNMLDASTDAEKRKLQEADEVSSREVDEVVDRKLVLPEEIV